MRNDTRPRPKTRGEHTRTFFCHEPAMSKRVYENLTPWRMGMAVARTVYEITARLPREQRWGLPSQMQRAAVSIPSNTAEATGYLSDARRAYFFEIARGSANELDTQLQLAHALGWIDATELQQLRAQLAEVGRSLTGLIRKHRG